MFLVDTNVWLEDLFDQERASEARLFFDQILTKDLSISRFSLHSIAVFLFRQDNENVFQMFFQDLVIEGGVRVIDLAIPAYHLLADEKKRLHLDLDDLIQYTCARQENLYLVSFDADFDKTDLKRLEPLQALELWKNRGTA